MDPYIWVPLSVAMQVVSLTLTVPKDRFLSLFSSFLPLDVFWSISSLVFLSFDAFGMGATSSLLFAAPLVHIANPETRKGISLVLIFSSLVLAGDSWTYWESVAGLETDWMDRIYVERKDIGQMKWVTALSLCIVLRSILKGGGRVPLFLSSRAEPISIGTGVLLLILSFVQIENRMNLLLSAIGILVSIRILQICLTTENRERRRETLLVSLLPNVSFLVSGLLYLFVGNDDEDACTKSILGSLFHAVSAGYISFLLSSSVMGTTWLRRGSQTSFFLFLLTISVLPSAFLSGEATERDPPYRSSSVERGAPVWMQMYHHVYVESTGDAALGLDQCRSEVMRYLWTGSRSLLLLHDQSRPRGNCWFRLEGEVGSSNCHSLRGREGEWILDDDQGGSLGGEATLSDCRRRGWKEYCDVPSVDYRLGSEEEVDPSSEERSPCIFVVQFGSEMSREGEKDSYDTHCIDPTQGVLQLCRESALCERRAIGFSCLAVLGVSLFRFYKHGVEERRRMEERRREGPA